MASNVERPKVSGAVRRVTVAVALFAVVAGAGYSTAHLYNRHQRYGVWTWLPSGATPKLPFRGRIYLRDGAATSTMTTGLVRIGTTSDGEILGPPATDTPTSIVVRLRDGASTYYSLSGGP
jgi:hypothetical protein